MIFLTLGTQLPFDRLVQALDDVAKDLNETIYGQIGHGTYKPANFEADALLTPTEFSKRFEEARVIVGHAGIGTILSGIQAQKPLVLMARQAKHGEHRNDHQLATVSQVRKIDGVYIVEGADDLRSVLKSTELNPMQNAASKSRENLVTSLRNEIWEGRYSV
ncbi:hypothetical protein ACMU_18025 [Actibacterium mucosum KCTC 23349]|uniref:Glycosyl transferase family 28 C-terminal domain-containing protein n=2 Tax=Actibacterium TaxID=1433986 RepID=A0A037ZDP4_9RHOB|nr:hypothetical protein ACMU_18025 [Actibacterium mucosum KCTC 23349]